jgi:hypothetical protein
VGTAFHYFADHVVDSQCLDADVEPIAHAVLVAKAPLPMTADPADLPWKRLTRGMRMRPMGKPFGGWGRARPAWLLEESRWPVPACVAWAGALACWF